MQAPSLIWGSALFVSHPVLTGFGTLGYGEVITGVIG